MLGHPVQIMNQQPQSNQLLNYVVIICDDIGWGDPGCYGHPSLQTPALDELAHEGTRFDAFYAGQPVCSARRAPLLTGCMPAKAGVTRLIGSGMGDNRIGSGIHLARHRPTVAQWMQKRGYQTACFGKWHLGFLEPEFSQPPSDFGFDYAFCTVSNSPFKDPDNWHRNGAPLGPLPGYATDIMMADVLRWLREERRPDDPAETRNRCADEPERVRTLTEELLAIRAENEAALDEARCHMDPVPPGLENRMA